MEKQFTDIIQFIKRSRSNAIKAVNVEMINLYWNIGAYINQKLAVAEWGDKTVDELANFIQKNSPDLKGFNKRGLYRMIQFYETYASVEFVTPVVTQLQHNENQAVEFVTPVVTQLHRNKNQGDKFVTPVVTQLQHNKNQWDEFVTPVVIQLQHNENQSVKFVTPVVTQFEFQPQDIKNTLLAQLSWTNHIIIFSRCKTEEEREFYIRLTIQEKYSKRELERQINSAVFERTMISNAKLPTALKEINADITNAFKDSYIFDFLNLPKPFNESDLQKGLINQIKNFILELGKDFLFIGEKYKVQVGNSDFYVDLLFYHRGLQCLVAFELKADKFMPEHLGQLNFYLEALDRDVKKANENPSIGVLLCKDKDSEIVKYALNRSLSTTMVAEYQMQLPDKKILQKKLHELFLAEDSID